MPWLDFVLAMLWLIGKLSVPEVIPVLTAYLKDPHPHVRMRTSYALGRIDPQATSTFIPIIMADKSQLVKNSYFQGLKRSEKTIDLAFFIRTYQSANYNTRLKMLQVFPYISESEKSANIFREWIAFQPGN